MAPYTVKWTSEPPGHQDVIPARHQDGVWSVCPVTVAGRDLLASGGGDGTVWLWDPATGEAVTVLEGRGRVNSVCPVTVADRDLLASGHRDGTVRVWDPATGEPAAAYKDRKKDLTPRVPITPAPGPEPVIALKCGGRAARSVCPVTVAGRNLLAAGSDDMTVRVWDPATGEQVAVLDRRAQGYWGGGFGSVCPITVTGRDLLAAGDDDGTVQVWDPATSKQVAVLEGHQGGVRSVCPVSVAGRNLVSGGEDNMVRVWDPVTGALLDTIPTFRPVTAVHEVATLLAIGHDFGVQVIKLDLST